MHRRDDWKTSAYAFVPHQTHFGELCGFADDVVAPGRGFGLHPHRDMEISTVVLAGAQRHEDSTGRSFVIDAGMVQTMSAGTGIAHSEMNASAAEPFHSLQIWIYPQTMGAAPRYDQFRYDPVARPERFVLALSPDGRQGSARIGQDAYLSLGRLARGDNDHYALHSAEHGAYVHCARGEVTVAGQRLGPGDAVGVWQTPSLIVEAHDQAEIVVVEVPMRRGVRVDPATSPTPAR
jgi:redox-sensitive bicupin YhaK (pirin superfamily)